MRQKLHISALILIQTNLFPPLKWHALNSESQSFPEFPAGNYDNVNT